jgi:hypothetical protein
VGSVKRWFKEDELSTRARRVASRPFASTEPCGDERTRTADPLLAKQVLYQLSYVPVFTFGNSEHALHTLPQPKKTLQLPSATELRGWVDPRCTVRRRSREDRAVQRLIDLVQRHDVALGTLPDNRERGSFHAGDTSPFPAFTVPFGAAHERQQIKSRDNDEQHAIAHHEGAVLEHPTDVRVKAVRWAMDSATGSGSGSALGSDWASGWGRAPPAALRPCLGRGPGRCTLSDTASRCTARTPPIRTTFGADR